LYLFLVLWKCLYDYLNVLDALADMQQEYFFLKPVGEVLIIILIK
jgi:hypothetical protein